MRISDWSSDVCSSDLYMLGMIQRQTMRHPRTPVVSTNKKLMMAKALHKRSHVLRHDPFRVSGTVFAGFWARRIAVSRSEERRVGKECVRPCRSRWSPYNSKTKKIKTH